jgi:opacity protein-like surface antigen
MHNKFFKIAFLLSPVLMAGVSVFGTAFAEDKQQKPNIHVLTSDKAATKVANAIPEETQERIPGKVHAHSIGLGLGQTFLRSDFGANGNDKITPDLYYNYSASHSFDFVANLHYSEHTYLDKKATIKGFALAIKGKVFQLDAFSPFVMGGFGFYLPSVKRLQSGILTETRTQLVFGVNAGAGVELQLNDKVAVGVLAHYHDPFDVRQDVGSNLEGSYMKLLIIASFTFN